MTMTKTVDRGKLAQILQFMYEFSCARSFEPTICEIVEGVGLRLTYITIGYLV